MSRLSVCCTDRQRVCKVQVNVLSNIRRYACTHTHTRTKKEEIMKNREIPERHIYTF